MLKRTLLSLLATILLLSAQAFAQNKPSDIPIEAFAKQPDMMSLKLSPNGDAIAMITVLDNQRIAIIQNLDGSERKYVGPREKYELATVYWVNNDDLLIMYRFNKTKGVKSMRFALSKLHSFNRKTEKFSELFKPDARYKDFMWNRVPFNQNDFISWLPDDPMHVMMSAPNGNEEYPAAFKLNIKSGARKTVRSGMRFIGSWRADRNDEVRLGIGRDWQSGKDYIKYKNNAGNWVDVSRDLGLGAEDNKYGIYGFDTQSDNLIIRGISEFGKKSMYKYDLETQTIVGTVFEDENYDAGGIIKDQFSQKIIGLAYYAETRRVKYIDPLWQSVHKQVSQMVRGISLEIYSKAKDTNRFLVYASSEQLPGMYFLYDHDTKQLSPIAQTQPEVNSRLMAPYGSITYKSSDDLEIQAYLTLPLGKAPKKLPVIIWPHGGPQSRTSKNFSPFVQFFANRGYAVLQPNFRGSTGFGEDFQLAMRGEWGDKMQDDVTYGTKWLIDQGIADPDRICIGGISYGGYAAAMGVIKEPSLYKCAISVNGVLDINDMINTDTNHMSEANKTIYMRRMGLAGVDPKTISPKHLVNKVTVPMLLISAKDDLTVNWENARDMHKAMKKNGKNSEYVSLNEGRHSMLTLKSRKTAMEAMEKFLDKHIGK